MPHDIQLGNPLVLPEHDAFNRQPFCKALADRIANLGSDQGAAVVGLYGRWGYGKSTILNFIKSNLIEHHDDKVSILEFNPWIFTSQEELLTAFFERLGTHLQIKNGTLKTFSEVLNNFYGALGMFPFVGGGAMKLGEQVGKHLKSPMSKQNRELYNILTQKKRPFVVVLIDDLDRLDRIEVMLMMKLVRLNANLPRMVYVLAFDDDVIAKTVATAYGKEYETGHQFLEKIVQFPFVIPAIGHSRLVDGLVQIRVTVFASILVSI